MLNNTETSLRNVNINLFFNQQYNIYSNSLIALLFEVKSAVPLHVHIQTYACTHLCLYRERQITRRVTSSVLPSA
jgi:hypothetical protein